MGKIDFLNVGPLTSIQDAGRFGALVYGVAASGPMDQGAFNRAGDLLVKSGMGQSTTALECATGRLEFVIHGENIWGAFCGGDFFLKIDGKPCDWEAAHPLPNGAKIEITPGARGNYAIVRLNHEFDVPLTVGSRSTNMIAKLGGFGGRLIEKSDVISLIPVSSDRKLQEIHTASPSDVSGPVRFIWGLHADLFSTEIREAFLHNPFVISPMLDRMGVRLKDPQNVFGAPQNLSLVSDTIVPGDIQILGDGTPIVLMRDHQPTGGYPRIATIISADLDRFAQLRPGNEVSFTSIDVNRAHKIFKSGG